MQVAQYTFRSPYPSPVQVGRLDPSSVKDNGTNSSQSDPAALTNETQKKAKNFEATHKKDVVPAVSNNLLDVYA
ncbi:hypothetical protein [Sulfurimonas paralvinellae]|uniref:Uncharacterized protein n=1 Tax=Sulfurimonas paralvinellae TaxID=317658 RepID=A0A7M1BA44_9BACT|nr:hypothetical protein [Sulfurimonas paralvinellae]QOP46590.1 hypothetical protein FM071_09920 [Sulfurimonas paralvinellae]